MFKLSRLEHEVYLHARKANMLPPDFRPVNADALRMMEIHLGLLNRLDILYRNSAQELQVRTFLTGTEEFAAKLAKDQKLDCKFSRSEPDMSLNAWHHYFTHPEDAEYADFITIPSSRQKPISEEDFRHAFDPVSVPEVTGAAPLELKDQLAESIAVGKVPAPDQRTWDNLTAAEANALLASGNQEYAGMIEHWVKDLRKLPLEVQRKIKEQLG